MNASLNKGLSTALLGLIFILGLLYGATHQVQLTSATPLSLAESPEQAKAAAQFREKVALAAHLSAKYRQPQPQVFEIVDTAYEEGAKHGLSPLLVLAIVEKESSLRVRVSNTYGAMGLMQVVPRFHGEKLLDPRDPKELLTTGGNIRVGTQIVAEYLRGKKGDLEKALVKYSGNARDYYPKVLRFKAELRRVLEDESDRPPLGA